MSRKIEEISGTSTSIHGILPYIDPKKLGNQEYPLNKKSDVYSIGVLLWEISSGQPPFKGNQPVTLPMQIIYGSREKVIPGTPEGYVRTYTGKYHFKLNYDLRYI